MITGIDLIEAERMRQIEVEGWTPAHDDLHSKGELASAAICYATNSEQRESAGRFFARLWPWSADFWKPTPDNRIRELTKAGALIAAEIDRQLRQLCELPEELRICNQCPFANVCFDPNASHDMTICMKNRWKPNSDTNT